MKVAQSESRLLTLTQALFDGSDTATIGSLLAEGTPIERIGPTAMGVLQRTLARGAVLMLSREGGWRTETRPSPTELSTGRLWERHSAPGLRFSQASFRVLRRLLKVSLATSSPSEGPALIGDGDHLLGLAAATALLDSGLPSGLALVTKSPLVQLAYAPFLAAHEVDWASWLPGREYLIEGTHDILAKAWTTGERAKRKLTSPEALIAHGTRQGEVIGGFLEALDALGRRDLADFLLTAGERVFDARREAGVSFQLDPSHTLRDRTKARRSATSFVDGLLTLERGISHDRGQRFFDDGYDCAQARLARWERFGAQRMQRVRETQAALLA